ncbi:heavy metal-associated isoprenylated plant protein 47-like [Gastrolobium bilobum]|uniref:heavy metal-associated isoprenylated plant protein 47-like n=1 Tax=Gastrolobium bilobum TaxID=150636 RepID=UPI002AB0A441|nr:heavy metal-associated isoprenylated plant protein 47-like [Gastrolobium bilobum]
MKKIIIQVQMNSDKCRSKAMKIAAVFQGVDSVSLEGESRDKVVVTGDGIDSVCLTNKLRKKFCNATLLSVGDAKTTSSGSDTTKIENMKFCYAPPPCPSYPVVYDSYPNTCSIL